MKNIRLTLLTGVAFPFVLAGSVIASAEEIRPVLESIVVAQADGLVAAQAEVAAAQAALQEAQASGGDVDAARARLEAALGALASAQAANRPAEPVEVQPEVQPEPPVPPQPESQPQPEAEPQSEVQPDPEPQPQAQPETPTDELPVVETPMAPVMETPMAPEAPSEPSAMSPAGDQPSATETPENNQPASPEASPVIEQPAPVIEQPADAAGDAPAPSEPTLAPQQSQREPRTRDKPKEEQASPAVPEPQQSAVDEQLEAQGDQEEAKKVRGLREKLRRDQAGQAPDSDARSSSNPDRRGEDGKRGDDGREAGKREETRDQRGPGDRRGDRPPEGEIVFDSGGRFIIKLGDQLVIRQEGAAESDRFLYRARDVDVEHFDGGFTRTTFTRDDGTKIYTVRNRYGDVITRTRVDRRGRQVILIDNRDFYREGRRPERHRFDEELPPIRLEIPRDQYIVETRRADRAAIREALMAPPVEVVERAYALDEIRTSERLRDKVRRVDLDTITFDFGSAAISPSQFDALSAVGYAMEDILQNSPDEIFLIEGHTDAVGTDEANLILSDRRAEAIAVALSSNFAIPPENLVTQGYGEQYLKVATAEPERENRRVTIRRITALAQGG